MVQEIDRDKIRELLTYAEKEGHKETMNKQGKYITDCKNLLMLHVDLDQLGKEGSGITKDYKNKIKTIFINI